MEVAKIAPKPMFRGGVIWPLWHHVRRVALDATRDFTWEDVDRVRSHADDLEAEYGNPESDMYDDGGLYEQIREWNNLADRIAALLPPREEA